MLRRRGRTLGRGIDVITTGSSFIDTRAFDPARHAAIADACESGGSTFLGVGLFPGFGARRSPRYSPAWPLFAIASSSGKLCRTPATRAPSCFSTSWVMATLPNSDVPMMSDPSRAGGAFNGTATVLAKALGLEMPDLSPTEKSPLLTAI